MCHRFPVVVEPSWDLHFAEKRLSPLFPFALSTSGAMTIFMRGENSCFLNHSQKQDRHGEGRTARFLRVTLALLSRAALIGTSPARGEAFTEAGLGVATRGRDVLMALEQHSSHWPCDVSHTELGAP